MVILQEFPDRMVATFSVIPSPKVSETVVEVHFSTIDPNLELNFNLSLSLAIQCTTLNTSTCRE